MTTKLHNPEIQDDGVWMTASSFTIFTMTAGFGLLESGRVSSKDEVNVMVKNVVDVIFGGRQIGQVSTGGGRKNGEPRMLGKKFWLNPEPSAAFTQMKRVYTSIDDEAENRSANKVDKKLITGNYGNW
ncbi:hypothetical protein ANCDUO_19118 [Ancylostoma duodenale]|uniref:Ammonium transporter AmtB-like domain-containing protein n=1 Tax=Ancylostoma duodenale TaxID=51022 RepID=A0A0C2FQK9_9BILA|nr:hypothetical protein ANCDUO_19118 [Ancylostoma duodenale]